MAMDDRYNRSDLGRQDRYQDFDHRDRGRYQDDMMMDRRDNSRGMGGSRDGQVRTALMKLFKERKKKTPSFSADYFRSSTRTKNEILTCKEN